MSKNEVLSRLKLQKLRMNMGNIAVICFILFIGLFSFMLLTEYAGIITVIRVLYPLAIVFFVFAIVWLLIRLKTSLDLSIVNHLLVSTREVSNKKKEIWFYVVNEEQQKKPVGVYRFVCVDETFEKYTNNRSITPNPDKYATCTRDLLETEIKVVLKKQNLRMNLILVHHISVEIFERWLKEGYFCEWGQKSPWFGLQEKFCELLNNQQNLFDGFAVNEECSAKIDVQRRFQQAKDTFTYDGMLLVDVRIKSIDVNFE